MALTPVQWLQDNKSWFYSLAEKLRNNPETGFYEYHTAEIIGSELELPGIEIQRNLALTGIKAIAGQMDAPSIALVADIDALPTARTPGGVAHSCGHYAQAAIMLAVFRCLVETGFASRNHMRIVFLATPAEEYVELDKRRQLKQEGKITYLSGKQEMIRLGVFDDIDCAIKYHSMSETSDVRRRTATINGILNGFNAKTAIFTGKASHAGAAPDQGINALNAAILAMQAIHTQRETFRDSDHVRVHPIIKEGGTVVNSVPDRAIVEMYVRGATSKVVIEANTKIDQALVAGALAIGASVQIGNTPGYQPFHPSPAMGKFLETAAREFVPEQELEFHDESFASDDIGDIACLMPTCQLGYGGFSGTIHTADFLPMDSDRAYLQPACILARTVELLARDGSKGVAAIKSSFVPQFTKAEYLGMLNDSLSERSYGGGIEKLQQ
jgi:amidohydrolase